MSGGTILQNLRLFAGGCDLTAQSNQFDLQAQFEKKDRTVYGPAGVGSGGWSEFIAGLGSAKPSVSGLWAAGDTSMVDDATWAALGANSSFSAYLETANGLATYGDPVYTMRMLTSNYKVGGAPGDVAPFSLDGDSDGVAVRGVGLHPPGTARGLGTATGTVVSHVAVPAGRHGYASLHVLSVAGTGTPTLAVTVQSAAAIGFAAPTDRITFAPATARGGQNASVAGPITDTFWRVSATVTGTTPSFLFVVAFGVGN